MPSAVTTKDGSRDSILRLRNHLINVASSHVVFSQFSSNKFAGSRVLIPAIVGVARKMTRLTSKATRAITSQKSVLTRVFIFEPRQVPHRYTAGRRASHPAVVLTSTRINLLSKQRRSQPATGDHMVCTLSCVNTLAARNSPACPVVDSSIKSKP